MKCPVDNELLVMTERSGVEIDYCPTCRGVWLDRGELDKIVERSETASQPVPRPRDAEETYSRGNHHGGRKSSKSRRKNLLSELLDF